MYKMFTIDHWDGTKEWTWDKQELKFNTPEERQLDNNVAHDPNNAIMYMYEKEEEEEQKRLEKLNAKNKKDWEAEERLENEVNVQSNRPELSNNVLSEERSKKNRQTTQERKLLLQKQGRRKVIRKLELIMIPYIQEKRQWERGK